MTPAAARRVVDGVVERYGRLDVVVNNAAGNFPAPITSISPNGFKAVVDIDLLGTYNVSRAAFDAWLGEHGGNIVNISAPFELRGVAMQAHVASAKAGVDSLTRTCAVEWGPHGVRVNAVAPGSIGGTEGVRRFADAVRGGDDTPTNPVGLMGHGADIAYCVLFLCTESARFISGQVIAVDGAGSADMLRLGARRPLTVGQAGRQAGTIGPADDGSRVARAASHSDASHTTRNGGVSASSARSTSTCSGS